MLSHLLLSFLLLQEQPAETPEASDEVPPPAEQRAEQPEGYWFPLSYRGHGLAFGNVNWFRGLRCNFRDRGHLDVEGVNFTLAQPDGEVTGEVRGVSLGLLASVASRLSGLQFGTFAVVAQEELVGANLSAMAVVSEGDARGASVAGFALVSGGDMTGASISGLAAVTQGNTRGIQLGGIASVSQGEMTGVQMGGFAVVSQGGTRGVQLAGLAVVSEGDLFGVQVGGLATVAGGNATGLNLAGLACVADDTLGGLNLAGASLQAGRRIWGMSLALSTIRVGDVGALEAWPEPSPEETATPTRLNGIQAALWRVQAEHIEGATFGGVLVRARDLRGFSLGAWNRIDGRQRGLSVGLLNYASELQGMQIGLLNVAKNNPAWARYLPLVNFHLD